MRTVALSGAVARFDAPMWLGVLYTEDGDDRPGGDEDLHALLVYAPSRIIVGAGPLGGIANAASVMRRAGLARGVPGMPRCQHCDAPLDVPDIDAAAAEQGEEGSSCVSS